MNVFAKFDEIPSMILEVIKETKRFGHTVGRTFGQRENSIPSHKRHCVIYGVESWSGVLEWSHGVESWSGFWSGFWSGMKSDLQ